MKLINCIGGLFSGAESMRQDLEALRPLAPTTGTVGGINRAYFVSWSNHNISAQSYLPLNQSSHLTDRFACSYCGTVTHSFDNCKNCGANNFKRITER